MAESDPNKFVAEYAYLIKNSCQTCAYRFVLQPGKCLAFPTGIPGTILDGDHDHKTPYEGDHGIQYKEAK